MSWVEASCLPGSASSSHLCPFVLQVFRRADKNGELWLPLGPQCGEGWETSGRLGGVGLGGTVKNGEESWGNPNQENHSRHPSQRECCLELSLAGWRAEGMWFSQRLEVGAYSHTVPWHSYGCFFYMTSCCPHNHQLGGNSSPHFRQRSRGPER